MKCGIFTNLKKDSELGFTLKLIRYLEVKGVEICVHHTMAEFLRGFNTFKNVTKKLDCIITVGGDGTILRIAKQCASADVPILGINLGTVGFLTEGEPDNFEAVIDDVVAGKYKIEQRALLDAAFCCKKCKALNDIVLARENDNKLMLIDVYIGNQVIDKHYCDGFIISTPTGSTAYSLSAGGAILSPTANVIELTPINSHSLHSRPIVIGEHEKVKIRICSGKTNAKIVSDGHTVGKFVAGDELSVEIAKEKVSFIRVGDANFYGKLLAKLNKWSVVTLG